MNLTDMNLKGKLDDATFREPLHAPAHAPAQGICNRVLVGQTPRCNFSVRRRMRRRMQLFTENTYSVQLIMNAANRYYSNSLQLSMQLLKIQPITGAVDLASMVSMGSTCASMVSIEARAKC